MTRGLARWAIWAGAVLAALWGLTLLADWRMSALEARAAQLAEMSRLTASTAALADRERQLRGSGALPLVWVAEREGEALARVQGHVSDLARANGISLRSMTPVPAPGLPLVTALGLRIEGEAPLDRFAEFLVALEHGERALLVRTGTVRRLARPGGEAGLPTLFVQLDLTAPVRIGEDDA